MHFARSSYSKNSLQRHARRAKKIFRIVFPQLNTSRERYTRAALNFSPRPAREIHSAAPIELFDAMGALAYSPGRLYRWMRARVSRPPVNRVALILCLVFHRPGFFFLYSLFFLYSSARAFAPVPSAPRARSRSPLYFHACARQSFRESCTWRERRLANGETCPRARRTFASVSAAALSALSWNKTGDGPAAIRCRCCCTTACTHASVFLAHAEPLECQSIMDERERERERERRQRKRGRTETASSSLPVLPVQLPREHRAVSLNSAAEENRFRKRKAVLTFGLFVFRAKDIPAIGTSLLPIYGLSLNVNLACIDWKTWLCHRNILPRVINFRKSTCLLYWIKYYYFH